MVREKVIPPNTIAHIVQRAPGKEMLFLEDKDYIYFLHLLKEIGKKFKLEVYAFSLLSNHFHILLKFLEDNAIKSIKNLCERYANYFNIKYQRKGHVFYGTFRASVCLDETYLFASSLYIHLNPLKANLTKDFFYRWSSSSLYLAEHKGESFINYKFILQLLSLNPDEARRIYYNLLSHSASQKLESIFENRRAISLFRSKIFSYFYKNPSIDIKIPAFLEEVSLQKRIEELKSKGRLRRPEEKEAMKYLIEQFIARGYSVEEIAVRLNLTRYTVYKYLNKSTKEALL